MTLSQVFDVSSSAGMRCMLGLAAPSFFRSRSFEHEPERWKYTCLGNANTATPKIEETFLRGADRIYDFEEDPGRVPLASCANGRGSYFKVCHCSACLPVMDGRGTICSKTPFHSAYRDILEDMLISCCTSNHFPLSIKCLSCFLLNSDK